MQEETLELQFEVLEMQKHALELQFEALEMQEHALELQEETLEMQEHALELQFERRDVGPLDELGQQPGMDRRQRRSSDLRTALHFYLESRLREQGAQSVRVTTSSGEIVAAVGDDAYADDWVATWTRRVEGSPLTVASSGGRPCDEIAHGIRRILG